jgi:hypothetical protein
MKLVRHDIVDQSYCIPLQLLSDGFPYWPFSAQISRATAHRFLIDLRYVHFWAAFVARLGKTRNSHEILGGRAEEKNKEYMQHHIKMDLK